MADVSIKFKGDSSSAVRAAHQTSGAIGGVSRAGGLLGRVLLRGGLAAGGAFAFGVGKAIKTAASFEKILDQLGAVSGASERQMKKLSDQALDFGSKTKFSAREAAQAQVELAKGGVTTANILGGALAGSLSLAAAGNMEVADAATIAANAMNLFKLRGKEVAHVADAMATAANTTTADVADFGMALTQGGAAAKAAGLSFDETMVVLEALAAAGVKNSDAGTSMKAAFLQLLTPTKLQAAAAKDAGLNFLTANGEMKNAVDISAMLRTKTEGMTKAQRAALFATVAGQDGIRTLLALYDAGPTKLDKFAAGLDKQGSAARTAARMQDNLAGQWERITGQIETLAIRIGDRLLPIVSAALSKLEDLLGFVDKLAAAKSPKIAVKVIFEGAGQLRDRLEAALFGELKSEPIKLPSGKIIDFRSIETEGLVDKITVAFENIDWVHVGEIIGRGIRNAFTGAGDEADKEAAKQAERVGKTYAGKLKTSLAIGIGESVRSIPTLGLIGSLFSHGRGDEFTKIGRGVSKGIIKGVVEEGSSHGPQVRGAFGKSLSGMGAVASMAMRPLAVETAKAATRAAGEARTGGASITRGMNAGLSRLGPNVEARLARAVGVVRGKQGEFNAAASSIGQGISSGILAGASSLGASLAAQLSRQIDGALGQARQHAQIKSPSELFARQLGKPLADGVVLGFLNGTRDLPDKVKDAVRNALERGREAVDGQRGRLASAFDRLASDALSAFDARTDKLRGNLQKKLDKALTGIDAGQSALTPTEALLAGMDSTREAARRAQAIADAQAALAKVDPADAAAVISAQQALDDALWAEQRVQLERQAETERAGRDLEAEAARAAAQAAYDAELLELDSKRELRRRHLEDQLAQLEAYLAKHPGKWKKVHKRIMKLFEDEFGPDMKEAGANLGAGFVEGLNESFAAVDSAAHKLAKLIAKYLRLNSPAEAGPLSSLDKWARPFAKTYLKGLDTGAIERALSLSPGGLGLAGAGGGVSSVMRGGLRPIQVTVTGNTLLGQNSETGRQIADIVEPEIRRQIGYRT